MQKMKTLKYLALALVAVGLVSCENSFIEEPTITPDAEQEIVVKKITLEAKKGNEDATRVYVGSANQSGTIYYWHETDKIGVFAMNTGSTMKNYEAKINQLNEGNKNLARFSSYLNYAPNNNENADLFIYWPYNSSNVVTDANAAVATYLNKHGVQIRTQSQQDQLVYGTEFGTMDHPSVNISKYGAAYDMTTCDNTGAGSFELHHQTAYLQFNAWGVVGETGSSDYGNGEFEVAKMVVRLGKISGSMSNGTLAEDATFTSVKIAGNFTYNVPTYNKGKVSYNDVKLLSGGGDDVVSVTLAEPQQLKDKNSKVPVFAVINAANITASNVNAIEATVTLNKKNAEGVVIGTFTRTRYISLGNNVIKGGDFYNISYKVNDPTIQNVALDAEGNSNCYIISYPGTYTFDVSFPGNGQLPYETTYSALGLPSSGKFFTTNYADYEIDWLWASGASFDAAGGVDGVVTVGMDAERGELVVKPQGSSELSGNLIVALHKKNSTEIIWTWHIWFCRPVLQNYNFPNTRPSIPINNENWYMFDRNLGAETNELGEVTSYGLYYQVGRHVPFNTPTGNGAWPANVKTTYVNSYFGQNWNSASMKFTEVYSKPMTLNLGDAASTTLSNSEMQGLTYTNNVATVTREVSNALKIGSRTTNNAYTYSWVTSDNPAADNSKTILDPCPLGYKLPTTREWDSFKSSEWEAALPPAICSGIFGYGALYSAGGYTNDSRLNTSDKYGDIAAIVNARQAAGDYWTSTAEGRSYSLKNYVGSDNLTPMLTSNFPNAGIIMVGGTQTITVNRTRQGNRYTYTQTAGAVSAQATVDNVRENFALWAAGRIDDIYRPMWFGPQAGGDYNYSATYNETEYNIDVNGDGRITTNAKYNWQCYVPWHSNQSMHNSPLGITPYNIGNIETAVDKTNKVVTTQAAAAPVRCIREYNSTETAE